MHELVGSRKGDLDIAARQAAAGPVRFTTAQILELRAVINELNERDWRYQDHKISYETQGPRRKQAPWAETLTEAQLAVAIDMASEGLEEW